MMRVLLTGASGFIGQNLLFYAGENKQSFEFVPLTSHKIDGYSCILHEGFSYGANVFKNSNIDHIDAVLLAGAHVEHSDNMKQNVRKHISSITNNLYVLEHLPNIPQTVVFLSSVAVYGFDQTTVYHSGNMPIIDEKSRISPQRTYALSKLLCERLVEEWCTDHQCRYQILRLGTTYGSQGITNNFLAYCINSARCGKRFDLYAPLDKTWNYVFADDVARWIMNSFSLSGEVNGPINLVSSHTYTTQEVLETVKNIWPSFEFESNTSQAQYGQERLFDAGLRERLLGREFYDLEKGLLRIRSICDRLP